ncbi:twin-arginine translocation signal domain-containing protein [Piscinibacterium candidicorallinum]|jgi:Na+/H+-dicarboxylate symporter|uniref:Twin-arginine translocation signal domain-containing protein n=1 Tax=Piscinibacterium candidicorallinum TaxID=1793872 RepID=A0ABV7H9I9_9BURK
MANAPARISRRTLLQGASWAALAAVLGLTFAAYFNPALRVELSNFWAMCVSALK